MSGNYDMNFKANFLTNEKTIKETKHARHFLKYKYLFVYNML